MAKSMKNKTAPHIKVERSDPSPVRGGSGGSAKIRTPYGMGRGGGRKSGKKY